MAGYENPEEDDGLEDMFTQVKSIKKKSEWGFLPILIDHIVEQRKTFKKKMKKATNPMDIMIYDIQQKCYKVVANSIYGCLGFSVSRFYSRPLAALITKKGRDSLLAARDIVMKKGGVKVIYGDTDSLMIEPSSLRVEDNASEV
jgi:DNA polymerase alpha subunit A